MSIPNRQAAVEEAKALYPRAWQHCHHEGDPEAWDFIILCARNMQTKYGDASFNYGLNAKRGNVNDPSMDVIYVRAAHETDGVYDVVGGAGGSNPQPSWNYLGPGENTTSGWLDPFAWETHYPYDGEQPPTNPTPPPNTAYAGDKYYIDTIGEPMHQDHQRANQQMNAGTAAWWGRVFHDVFIGEEGTGKKLTPEESVNKHRSEWQRALGLIP